MKEAIAGDLIKGQKLIRTCSIWRALGDIGDVPTLLILEAVWLQENRFDRIQARAHLPRALVSKRLKDLIGANILRRERYLERPPRFEYHLSEKGRDLYWVTLMLLRWERRWSSKKSAVTIELTHADCGARTEPEPYCGHCRQVVRTRDISWRAGPGLGLMAPVYPRRRQYRNREAIADNHSLFTDSAEILGDRWASLILRSVFTGLRRFDQILDDTAMATNILTDRLGWLVERGILKAARYQTAPVRAEYRLTEKGLSYFPVLMMLQQWGDRYYAAPEGPPLILFHETCGAQLDAYVGCSNCHSALTLSATRVAFRPGHIMSGGNRLEQREAR